MGPPPAEDRLGGENSQKRPLIRDHGLNASAPHGVNDVVFVVAWPKGRMDPKTRNAISGQASNRP
jgi:hypothetical protein